MANNKISGSRRGRERDDAEAWLRKHDPAYADSHHDWQAPRTDALSRATGGSELTQQMLHGLHDPSDDNAENNGSDDHDYGRSDDDVILGAYSAGQYDAIGHNGERSSLDVDDSGVGDIDAARGAVLRATGKLKMTDPQRAMLRRVCDDAGVLTTSPEAKRLAAEIKLGHVTDREHATKVLRAIQDAYSQDE
jgi:hypothetical protein